MKSAQRHLRKDERPSVIPQLNISALTFTPWYLVRFLDLIKPFTPLLPEVAAPETSKTPFNQKLMWTGVSLSLPGLRDAHHAIAAPSLMELLLVDTSYIPRYESDAAVWNCVLGFERFVAKFFASTFERAPRL